MPYRKKTVETDVLTLARQRIHRTYELFDHVAVSFSGGKDSTVILNLALEVARERGKLPLEVVFWDEEAITPETVDYCARVRENPDIHFRWLAIPVKHRNGCSRSSPWWRPFDPACEELWCRRPPEYAEQTLEGFNGEPIPQLNGLLFPRDGRTVGMLLGIRADESVNRYRSVASKLEDNWMSWDKFGPHVGRCKPIYDWTSEDVWLAPHLLGWDYNRSYDLMSAMGISLSQQRVAPPFGEEPMQRLYTFQICWPELWDTMCRRVPGAATAARYSRTEVYGFGGQSKAGDMTWKETIALYLQRWQEPERTIVAKNIRSTIAYHVSKTKDAIPDEQEHEDSGVSWKYLAMLASRGDLKGRRRPKPGLRKKSAQASDTSGESETEEEALEAEETLLEETRNDE